MRVLLALVVLGVFVLYTLLQGGLFEPVERIPLGLTSVHVDAVCTGGYSREFPQRVLFGWDRDNIYLVLVDLSSGSVLATWQHPIYVTSRVFSTFNSCVYVPDVDPPRAYVGDDQNLYSVDLQTGEWTVLYSSGRGPLGGYSGYQLAYGSCAYEDCNVLVAAIGDDSSRPRILVLNPYSHEVEVYDLPPQCSYMDTYTLFASPGGYFVYVSYRSGYMGCVAKFRYSPGAGMFDVSSLIVSDTGQGDHLFASDLNDDGRLYMVFAVPRISSRHIRVVLVDTQSMHILRDEVLETDTYDLEFVEWTLGGSFDRYFLFSLTPDYRVYAYDPSTNEVFPTDVFGGGYLGKYSSDGEHLLVPFPYPAQPSLDVYLYAPSQPLVPTALTLQVSP